MSLKRVFPGDLSEASSDTQEREQRAGLEPLGGCCLSAGCSRLCWQVLGCESFQVAQWLRIRLETQEMQVHFLRLGDPLEGEMVTHSSILAWKIPWAEGPQRVRHN